MIGEKIWSFIPPKIEMTYRLFEKFVNGQQTVVY